MNNEMQNENQVGLIKKLMTRFHNPKIAKTILSLVLAYTLTTTLVACDLGQTPDIGHDNTDTSIETTTDNINGNNNQNDKSLFKSELMKNLLKDTEYISLMRTAQRYPSLYKSAKFDPHPYAFLEEEGHNIEAIKNDELECRTQSFVFPDEPNYLYIATYVQCPGDYYEHYLLKYHLTDEEMKDYDYAHKHNTDKFYIEAVFLNNEISKSRDPIIINNSQVSTEAHNNLQEAFNNQNKTSDFGSNYFLVLLKNYDKKSELINLYVLPRMATGTSMKSNGKFGHFEMSSSDALIYVSNGIYIQPNRFGQFLFSSNNDNQQISEIIVYASQSVNLEASYRSESLIK